MNVHVPLGCCVMRLNRSERATATCRLLGKCLMGTPDSPDNIGGALAAVGPRWAELYLRLRSCNGGGDEGARTFGWLRHAFESQ